MHTVWVWFWETTSDHMDEFFHVFDVTQLLIMTFFFCGFGMELVLREEGEDELPIGTIRDINSSDCPELGEIPLGIVEFFLCPYIIEIGILDDLLEMCFWLREENGCHDNPLYLIDTMEWMIVRLEPSASDLDADKFVFRVLFSESCIMKETGKLEIDEILTIYILRECYIGRAIVDSEGMLRIVIGVVLTFSEDVEDIGSSLIEEIHILKVGELEVRRLEGCLLILVQTTNNN
jgi:hypothetical protein